MLKEMGLTPFWRLREPTDRAAGALPESTSKADAEPASSVEHTIHSGAPALQEDRHAVIMRME